MKLSSVMFDVSFSHNRMQQDKNISQQRAQRTVKIGALLPSYISISSTHENTALPL